MEKKPKVLSVELSTHLSAIINAQRHAESLSTPLVVFLVGAPGSGKHALGLAIMEHFMSRQDAKYNTLLPRQALSPKVHTLLCADNTDPTWTGIEWLKQSKNSILIFITNQQPATHLYKNFYCIVRILESLFLR